MAIELRFNCSRDEQDFLSVKSYTSEVVTIRGEFNGGEVEYYFDIQTAIKFAKTLRTEINKAKKEGRDV